MEENPNVALVGSNVISFGEGIIEKDGLRKIDCCKDPEVYKIRSLFQHSGPAHPTFMLRTAFLKRNNIQYREDILKAQDYGIMTDILRAKGEIRKIPEPLLKYRLHSDQVSSTSEIEQKLYQCRVSFDYLCDLFPEICEHEKAAISMLGNRYDINSIMLYIDNHGKMKDTCYFLVDYKKELYKASTYINAIKDMLKINKKKICLIKIN